ncbi:MAG: hypothetical protein WA653_02220, partial [Candidatus Sulfotelmatobacter sp.]
MKATIELPEPAVKVARPAGQRSPTSSLQGAIKAAQVRPLFSDCLLQYEGQKGRQTWATIASFGVQCVMLGVLLLLPLYFTQELPKAQLLTFLVAPPPPPPPPPPAQQAARIMRVIQSD